MKLIGDISKVEVSAPKCKRPKIRDYAGRTWSRLNKKIDGVEVEFYLDTTWGHYMYFIHADTWRKIPVSGNGYPPWHPKFKEIEPFEESGFTIKKVGIT